MASPDKSKRKILKAKKTMPTSCRKQIEILNKSRNVDALKTTAIGNNASSSNQNLSTMVINNKSKYSENVDSSLDSNKNLIFSQKNRLLSQNLIKPVEETVDSETRLKNVNERVTLDSPRKFFIQEVKNSQNTSETHLDSQANVTGPFLKHEENCDLKSSCYPPIVFRGIVQHTLNDKRIDKVVSNLEANSSSESQDKRQNILSPDSHFLPVKKASDLVNSISYSNYTVNILKSEKPNRTSILNCEKTNSKQQSLFDTESNNGHNQKKRIFSENKENVKRMKPSEQINENENICVALEKQTAALEQVKHLIRQEICSINYKLFDKKLNELNERIGKTQCRNKHEATASELFAKIARLQRRIRTVVSQGNCLEPNTLSRNTACKTANSEIINSWKNQELVNGPNERMTSVNCEPSNLSEKESEKNNLSPDSVEFVSESNTDDVTLISVESPNSTIPVTSNLTDIRKTTSVNSSDSHNVISEAKAVKKKLDFVIDLTEEGQKSNTENLAPSLESPSEAVLNSKEITPVAENVAEEFDSFEHLPPLPEPPPPLPELEDRILDTLPPQKPELKVKRVLRPMGIALTWNIAKINPKCAPVESYHLFLCHESSSDKLMWKKIGEIKALPLPMACTLSQFFISNKYYFTVQSKDIFGRYGPFCDIKSIPGFSENLA